MPGTTHAVSLTNGLDNICCNIPETAMVLLGHESTCYMQLSKSTACYIQNQRAFLGTRVHVEPSAETLLASFVTSESDVSRQQFPE